MSILGYYELIDRLAHGQIIPDAQHRRTASPQPASIDLTLADEFLYMPPTRFFPALGVSTIAYAPVPTRAADHVIGTRYGPGTRAATDPDMDTRPVDHDPADIGAEVGVYNVPAPIQHGGYTSVRGLKLWPGAFVLGRTYEHVNIPLDLVGQVDGKSGIGRVGIGIHVTAGLIDPGFIGPITLEITNMSDNAIVLPIGMACCQLILSSVVRASMYNGSYQNAKGVEGSLFSSVSHGRSPDGF